jgi:hypothetical protein
MNINSKEILDIIRSRKSEYNIKTLNTIDTIDTKHYDISSVFADAGKALPSSTSSSSFGSLPEGVPPAEETVGLLVASVPEITYLSASLKAPKTLRRTLNIDFRLATTPAGYFNKFVFSLAHSSRQREFFSNIPEEYRNEWEYQEAYGKFATILSKDKWLGKGRPRDKFIKGQITRSKIELGSSCVLELKQSQYIVHLWLDGVYKELVLNPVDNQQYPFRYDSGSSMQTVQILPRRSSWK